jgi:hypothetical protein
MISEIDWGDRFWSKVDASGDCWLWTAAKARFGYGYFYDGKPALAHRVAFARARGPIPAGLCVLHRCDNPPCVNPDHLWLGTRADNNADRDAKGRDRRATGDRNASRKYPELYRGERNGRARLTAANVSAIRARLATGEKQVSLAAEFGVCKQTINCIALGETWRGVA